MTQVIKYLTEIWEFLTVIVVGVGGFIAWLSKRRTSNAVLYETVEELRLKVLESIKKDVETAELMRERDSKIQHLEIMVESLQSKIKKLETTIKDLKEKCPEYIEKD